MARNTPVREQAGEGSAVGTGGLLLAVLASVVGTVATGFFGAGRLGTLAGAVAGPLITAAFSTRGRGTGPRAAGMVLLTLGAVAVTFGGFTASDLLRGGESPVADRKGTFVDPPAGTQDKSGLSIPDRVTCPRTEVDRTSDCRFAIRPAGNTTVKVTGAELDGRHQDDYRLTKVCNGSIAPGQSCSIRLKFTPSEEGERKVDVIVEHSSGTTVTKLVGEGAAATSSNGCAEGFVPRNATAGDTVCVTRAERTRASQQNGEQDGRVRADGTCVDGYVWREATPDDRVCVTPGERDDTARQNALHRERSTG